MAIDNAKGALRPAADQSDVHTPPRGSASQVDPRVASTALTDSRDPAQQPDGVSSALVAEARGLPAPGTPGPWEYPEAEGADFVVCADGIVCDIRYGHVRGHENGRFIAAAPRAREIALRLADEVEPLRAAVRRLEKTLDAGRAARRDAFVALEREIATRDQRIAELEGELRVARDLHPVRVPTLPPPPIPGPDAARQAAVIEAVRDLVDDGLDGDRFARLRRAMLVLDGNACEDGECCMPRSHGGEWHDDGHACWPIDPPVQPTPTKE